MYKLNCFARNFSLAPSRMIFQHGGEVPSQAPKPPEGAKKETPPEKSGKDAVDAAKRRLETLNQNKFKERVDKVQELQKKLAELNSKQEKTMKSGQEEKMDSTQETEYKLIHEQMVDLAKQFNQELGLNIDFQNLQFLDVEVKGKGMYMTIQTEGPDKKLHFVAVGFRPDGSHETREDIYPDRTVSYSDSRTGEKVTYGPLPVPGAHIPEVVNPDGSRIQSLEVENTPAQQKFQKERAGRFYPSTE